MKSIKVVKRAFILILFCFMTVSSFGCLAAYQNKMFPIANLGDSLMVCKVEIIRGGNIEKKEYFDWTLLISLDLLDNKFHCINTLKTDTLKVYNKPSYINDLKKVYSQYSAFLNRSYKKASLIKNCEFLRCNFLEECVIKLQKDTNAISFWSGTKCMLTLSAQDTAFNHYIGISNQDDFEHILFSKLSSIRYYKINGKSMMIVHVQAGHEISMDLLDPKRKPTPKIPFHTLCYEEELLHHGRGIDIIFWQ